MVSFEQLTNTILKGIDGNGGLGGFTDSELENLKGALVDLADRIRRASDNL